MDMKQRTGSKLGKEYYKAAHCHSAYLNVCSLFHTECWARWSSDWNRDCQEKYQQPQICRWYHSNSRKWRGTKEPLDEGGWDSEKAGSKVSIQKTKIMAFGPITSKGKMWKQWQIFLSWVPKSLCRVTAAMKFEDTCSLEGKLWQT